MNNILRRIIQKVDEDLHEHIIKVAIVVATLATLFVFTENIFLAFVVAAISAVLLLGWDNRIFFSFGLLFLVFCPFLLAVDNKQAAEDMAVYAYYMLAIGVGLEIIQHAREHYHTAKKRKRKIFKRKKGHTLSRKEVLSLVGLVIAISMVGSFFIVHTTTAHLRGQLEKQAAVLEALTQEEPVLRKIAVAADIDNEPEQNIDPVQVVQIHKPTVSWEEAEVIVEHAPEYALFTDAFLDDIRSLGVVNLSKKQMNVSTSTGSYIRYCAGCYNVAQELVSLFPPEEQVELIEVDSENEIFVHKNANTLAVDPSTIQIAILNGSTIRGIASEFSQKMVDAGYRVVSIGDANRYDYKKPILSYNTKDKIKLAQVKQFLQQDFRDIEIRENPDLPVDIELILSGA